MQADEQLAAELIVVTCHGTDWIDRCQATLAEHAPATAKLYVDTAPVCSSKANVGLPGVWPTGTLLWAYQQMAAFDRFLLMQDSMVVLADPLPWFRDQWTGSGAVAWQRFPMQWDGDEQAQKVVRHYPDVAVPSHGIFGPVFYTDRSSLDLLAGAGRWPDATTNRMDAQGAERAWAFAFASLGMPVVGPDWNPDAMQSPEGFGPFRKTFAGRP